MKPISFGIALGSNLGDRQGSLEEAVDLLLARVPSACLVAGASLYETDPVDCVPGSQAFLNTVVEMVAPVSPVALHTHLVTVEAQLGRPMERMRNSPRPVDLDLLYADSYISNDPVLTVPHPRLHQRRFVLQPLAEIRPHLVLPGFQQSVAECLALLTDDPASVRLYGPWGHRCVKTDEAPERDLQQALQA